MSVHTRKTENQYDLIVNLTKKRRRTVLVSNLPEGMTENNVWIHFQKKKNGGGEVEKVQMLGEGKARVVFEEREGSSHNDFWKYIRYILHSLICYS